ncbi:uncharacterized [Tachysurus ichikawai]
METESTSPWKPVDGFQNGFKGYSNRLGLELDSQKQNTTNKLLLDFFLPSSSAGSQVTKSTTSLAEHKAATPCEYQRARNRARNVIRD